MCGFAGFLGGIDGATLSKMASAIIHRGPDSSGVWVDEQAQISLAHRRLSILDLSEAGHQPMSSPSGRYVIVFNGEIYNHLELRKELSSSLRGAESDEAIQKKSAKDWIASASLRNDKDLWRGHSDTETLLAGFDSWGIEETIKKSIGMFAFALWDTQEQILTLGRDRIGEKPLYYGWQGESFLFGSELKALRAHRAFSAEIDRNSLAIFMRHGYVPAPYSIYKNIFKLPPASLLTVSSHSKHPLITTYWSGTEVAKNGVANQFTGTKDQAVDALEILLKDAIKQQMVADVPLGAFLSGGIDSSTIVALMQAQSPRPIKTFTIGFNEEAYNEARHASIVAKHLGTQHTELYITPQQAMAVIPKLPTLYDEPFADSSQIPTFLVAQLAKQQVTVSLSGDAGDELFCGYNRYKMTATLWNKISLLPLPVRNFLATALTSISPVAWDKMASAIHFRKFANLGDKIHKGANTLHSKNINDLYMKFVSQWHEPEELVIGGREPATLLTGNQPDLVGLNDIEKMMLLDMLTYLPDDILAKVDRAAMGVSLETRVPFLDHRVVEFAWQLPLEYKLREGKSKWALREVLYRYVPKELIERPKMGFGVPIDNWLRTDLRDWAENLLSAERLTREGYFNPAPIRKKWTEHLSGKRNWQHQLWNVLMFQAWLQEQ